MEERQFVTQRIGHEELRWRHNDTAGMLKNFKHDQSSHTLS